MSRLPSAPAVRDLLSDLLSRPVAVEPGRPVVVGPASPASVGMFTDVHAGAAGACALDLALSAHAAGALSLMPPRSVSQTMKEHSFPEILLDGLHEVLNVLSALVNSPSQPHASLSRAYRPHELVPVTVLDLLAREQHRLDLQVTVRGYGVGGLSVVIPL